MSQITPDYYAILGVLRGASAAQIESAFRAMALRCHPDVCPEDGQAAAKFKQINEAREVLLDPERRRRYDRQQVRPRSGAEKTRSRPQKTRAETPLEGFERIFTSLFGRDPWDFGSSPAEDPDGELAVEVVLTREEARRGLACALAAPSERECPDCEGLGRWGPVVCDTCGGAGVAYSQARLPIRIPPGVTDGTLLQVSTPHGRFLLRIRVQRG